MTTDELAGEFGRIFEQEWKRAARWAIVRAFVWGMITGATINLLAHLI